VSISFSAAFKTRASLHRGAVYRLNSQMRSVGLRPAPYGKGAFLDAIKYQASRAVGRAQRMLNIQLPES
jgi:hypothetical protein